MTGKQKGAEPPAELWDAYRKLGYEQRAALMTAILRDQFSNQKHLLYGWPVQRLYSRYATDFLPPGTCLRILELGPGDTLMTSALWMLEDRVEHLTLMDLFKGEFVESADYHRPMLELVKMLHHLQREGFNNFYPFETLSTERLENAIQIGEEGVRLDPGHIAFVQTDDFTAFPFPDGNFNYVYSHATLEHYLDPAASIREMNRVLEPGGLMAHQIDIRDHRHFEKDPFRYLETPSAAWHFGKLGFPVNQWRACQFAEAFEAGGFTILERAKVRREPEKLAGVRLAPEFAALPADEVAVTGVVFLLRKTAEAVKIMPSSPVRWSPPSADKDRTREVPLARADGFADGLPEAWSAWGLRACRADDSELVLSTQPGKGGGVQAECALPDNEGGMVEVTAEVVASNPGKVALNVYADFDPDNGEDLSVRQHEHPGDGNWHSLKVEMPVDSNRHPYRIRVAVVVRQGADETRVRRLNASFLPSLPNV